MLAFTAPMWTLTGCKFVLRMICGSVTDRILPPDDSAAHISEEVAGAARAAPIAIVSGHVYCCAIRSDLGHNSSSRSQQQLAWDGFSWYQCLS